MWAVFPFWVHFSNIFILGLIRREEAESRLDELDAMVRERDTASNGRDVSQDALARMAIRNTQLKVCVVVYFHKYRRVDRCVFACAFVLRPLRSGTCLDTRKVKGSDPILWTINSPCPYLNGRCRRSCPAGCLIWSWPRLLVTPFLVVQRAKIAAETTEVG